MVTYVVHTIITVFFGSVTRNITRGLNTDKASKIEKKQLLYLLPGRHVKNLAKKN